jgi:hypothetical protein
MIRDLETAVSTPQAASQSAFPIASETCMIAPIYHLQ